MSKENQLVSSNDTFSLTVQEMRTLVNAGIVPQGTPTSQIKVFAEVCKAKGLSPFSKEIYLVGYNGKYSTITGIDGYRKMAVRTGEYAGKEDAKYNLKADGSFQSAYEVNGVKNLRTCTITVYRFVQNQKAAFTHTVLFSEFNGGKQKWKTMPFQMIAKVAECFALKMAFSDVLSGIHSDAEQAAFNNTQEEPEALN